MKSLNKYHSVRRWHRKDSLYTQRWIFVFLRLLLVYSQLILGSLFMVPERSTLSVVIHCLNALFCFILCTRRECGAPNGSTAFLRSAFVLEGFLTSQPKNTQALLLPQGKIRTGNSLIERKPACIPSRWAQHGMFDHSEKKKKKCGSWTPTFWVFCFFFSSILKGRKKED